VPLVAYIFVAGYAFVGAKAGNPEDKDVKLLKHGEGLSGSANSTTLLRKGPDVLTRTIFFHMVYS
jgi:hypothetical protein